MALIPLCGRRSWRPSFTSAFGRAAAATSVAKRRFAYRCVGGDKGSSAVVGVRLLGYVFRSVMIVDYRSFAWRRDDAQMQRGGAGEAGREFAMFAREL